MSFYYSNKYNYKQNLNTLVDVVQANEIYVDINNFVDNNNKLAYGFTEGDKMVFLTTGGPDDTNAKSLEYKIKRQEGSFLVIDGVGITKKTTGSPQWMPDIQGSSNSYNIYCTNNGEIWLKQPSNTDYIKVFDYSAYAFNDITFGDVIPYSSTNNVSGILTTEQIAVCVVGDNGICLFANLETLCTITSNVSFDIS